MNNSQLRFKARFLMQSFHRVRRGYARLFGLNDVDYKFIDDPKVVSSLIISGTFIFLISCVLLLTVSFVLHGRAYVVPRILVGLLLIGYDFIALRQLKVDHVKRAAIMILSLYYLLALATVSLWSIDTPFGLLLFGFVIVASGVTIGPIYAMRAAILVAGTLMAVQLFVMFNILHPDRSALYVKPSILDVLSFTSVFLLIALVAWISGRQMNQALKKAVSAERAVAAEKRLLAARLAQRTRKLQEAQLLEMQQLYRFAELGQLSTALLHDLASHLTALTLDIEDIHKERHSNAIKRAKKSIYYLDELVEKVRGQLHGEEEIRQFNVYGRIQKTIERLKTKASAADVKIRFDHSPDRSIYVHGDTVRFEQVIAIILSNAIEAQFAADGDQPVEVSVTQDKNVAFISITDYGIGISARDRAKLFKPFHSTKPTGMGIGLFIAKEIIESHFKGAIILDASTEKTSFIIKLPR